MAVADVFQCLQALDVPSLALSAGEKKAKLRGEIGIVEEEKGGGVQGGKGEKEVAKEKTPTPADKARINTENAKKAAEVRRKVIEAKQKRAEEGVKK